MQGWQLSEGERADLQVYEIRRIEKIISFNNIKISDYNLPIISISLFLWFRRIIENKSALVNASELIEWICML